MYNRYVPQADGSFRRSRIQDEEDFCEQVRKMPEASPPPAQRQRRYHRPRGSNAQPPVQGVGNFLRSLLPKSFDTEDLLIVLLLLLMSGDCKEDQNTALLTLAIYLFL